MRYVHDDKLLKHKQSIGIEKIDDNHYCFIYAYCSPKDHYSKKKAREIIDDKYKTALKQMDMTRDCSVVVHSLNGQNVIDSIIITPGYLSGLIYQTYFPKGIFIALTRHSIVHQFDNMDLLKMEGKDLKQLLFDIRRYAANNFF